MGLNCDSFVVDTEVLLPLDLNLNLSESLPLGSSARVHIVVNVLDVDHYKL